MSQQLTEGLDYKDLDGMLDNTVSIDKYESKMGDDDDIVTAAFIVRDEQAADDLVNWFEKGYDFVLDADRSPGEVQPNRFLVFVELKRRTTTGANIERILSDLETLTDLKQEDWKIEYKKSTQPWSEEAYSKLVPQSPADYRRREEGFDADLNTMKTTAGLEVKTKEVTDKDIKAMQDIAGI